MYWHPQGTSFPIRWVMWVPVYVNIRTGCFPKNRCSTLLSLALLADTSKNTSLLYDSNSYVNVMFGSYEFTSCKIVSILSGRVETKVSSSYRFQLRNYNSNFGKVLSCNDIMKIFPSSRPSGDPIATPSHWI